MSVILMVIVPFLPVTLCGAAWVLALFIDRIKAGVIEIKLT